MPPAATGPWCAGRLADSGRRGGARRQGVAGGPGCPSCGACGDEKRGARRGTQPLVTTLGTPDGGRQQIEVDVTRHSIAVAGEWWYRGVYTVEPHAQDSLLVYRVYNIAPGIGWWVAQLVQGPQHARSMRQHLEPLLRLVGERLECPVVLHGG